MELFDEYESEQTTEPETVENNTAESFSAPIPEAPVPPQEDANAHTESTGKRPESPYVNSPYYRAGYQPPQYQPQYHANAGYTGSYQVPPTAKPKKEKARNAHPVLRSTVSAVLTVALVAGGCVTTGTIVSNQMERRNNQTISELTQKINDLQAQIDRSSNRSTGESISGSPVSSIDGLTPGQVYAQNVDSVVAISSTVRSANYFGQVSEGISTGSGFIISEDGYVVTNYHVVEGGTHITVTTHAGEELEAAVVGTDSINDVAVLKVETEGLPAVTLGSSEDLIIGDMVVAIGNPLGTLTATQTVGYVSGKNREVTTDNTVINMIQTDAAINSGNSGGPLFNMKGEVVGITTAKYSGSTSSGASIEGISFAIPIDDVMGTIGDLRDFGYITGAYLGVTVQNTDAASASLYGLPTGAYVASVVEGGSADRAGVKTKDIIIKLGDYDVATVTDLTRALRHFKADDETFITVIRNGMQIQFAITLDEKPHDLNTVPADEDMPSEGNYQEWYDYFHRDDNG